jgi:hypothetical protein
MLDPPVSPGAEWASRRGGDDVRGLSERWTEGSCSDGGGMFASAQVKEADSWQPGFSARTAKLFAKAAGEKSTARDLSVVVPCFNETERLFELHRRLTASCQKIGNYEVILVNDGSRDGTWPLMCQLADADPRLVSSTCRGIMGTSSP